LNLVLNKMNVTKNDELDLEDFTSFFLERHPVMKYIKWFSDAIEMCFKEIPPHFDEFQKHSNFTKDKCDMKLSSTISCLVLQMFHVS
jgi:hypothetical protein